MELIVKPDGSLRCLYTELLDLFAMGAVAISRASHVEPDPNGQWLADLAPVHGPILGPFVKRSEALDAERQWLEANWL